VGLLLLAGFWGVKVNLTFWNIDRFLSRVSLEDSRPLIDLTTVTFFEPFALVYFGMYLRHYVHLGRSFNVRPPRAEGPRDYLARVNFWERFHFNPSSIQREQLRRFIEFHLTWFTLGAYDMATETAYSQSL
jgi:hypothetical protein